MYGRNGKTRNEKGKEGAAKIITRFTILRLRILLFSKMLRERPLPYSISLVYLSFRYCLPKSPNNRKSRLIPISSDLLFNQIFDILKPIQTHKRFSTNPTTLKIVESTSFSFDGSAMQSTSSSSTQLTHGFCEKTITNIITVRSNVENNMIGGKLIDSAITKRFCWRFVSG